MPHVYRLEDVQAHQSSLVTIGVFDGMHRGHQTLIQRLVNTAHDAHQSTIVVTFFPHPDMILRGLNGRYYLMSPEQRAAYLLGMGVDWVVTHPFDDSVRHVRASSFVDRLLGYLRMRSLWVGADFALGYQREGNVQFLQTYGAEKGFSVHTLDLISHTPYETIISSSVIRDLLSQGQVEKVRDFLGRGYEVTGHVVNGNKRGRLIGFPTANIAVWEHQVIPMNGVYAGWVTVGAERYMAVTNVGVRPTFNSNADVTVEAHLLDFEGEIYGESIALTFEARLRDEQKFAGIEALSAQLQRDVAAGRESLLKIIHQE